MHAPQYHASNVQQTKDKITYSITGNEEEEFSLQASDKLVFVGESEEAEELCDMVYGLKQDREYVVMEVFANDVPVEFLETGERIYFTRELVCKCLRKGWFKIAPYDQKT